MQLLYSPASPFVRKVSIVALETGLDSRIEKVTVGVNPAQPNADVAAKNPLVKIPALTTDDGQQLIESKVICQYLDSLAGNKLVPASGPARWAALRMEAIADGLADAGLLVRFETTLRPDALRWQEWIAGQTTKVGNALDALEREHAELNKPLHLGHIAVACACSWLEFRNVIPGARDTRPNLFTWVDRVNKERPSFTATMPK